MQLRRVVWFLFLLGLMNATAKTAVYFGTYTREDSKGIYRADLDDATGQVSPPVLAAEVANPSFLAFHPLAPWLYAVSEIADHGGQKSGAVSSFRIQADGSLSSLNQQPTGGAGSCYVSVDPSGGAVLVANYSGGSCASFPVQPDGSLGPSGSFHQHAGASVDPRRQTGPHAHSIVPDPNGHRALVPDLGLDRIFIYALDAGAGTLVANDPPFVTTPAGGGPRHLAFHPKGPFAFANLEMGNQLVAFTYQAESGLLTAVDQQSTLPADFQGANTTAETLVHPSGRFVYVSNRGHDSLAAFAIDPATGRLRFLGCTPSGGQMPRNFGIDPSGRFLLVAHQKSGNVVSFAIDQETGSLSPTGFEVRVSNAVCVRFLQR